MSDRRTLLKRALLGAAGLSLPPFAATGFTASGIDLTPVSEGLVLLRGAGGNVLVLSTGDGQVLVDSGAAEFGDVLLATLDELPGERVRTLFNTHWHLEQTGSNEALGRAGATIVAHEKTRLHLATDYYLPDEDRYQPALAQIARPTETFYTQGSMTAGGENIDFGYLLEAHTDGDIYVHFRNANVIAVGDAVSPLRDPELDWFGGGWIGGRVDSLKLLLDLGNAATRFVPSYGPVIGRADVQAEYDLMLTLFERMVELIRQGMSADEVLEAGVMDGLARKFDDPFRFVYAAHKSLWAHHNTLSPDIV
jgi:glyoxylase-like metal-dependent hydrolase (beta-lactamase superfamily II)